MLDAAVALALGEGGGERGGVSVGGAGCAGTRCAIVPGARTSDELRRTLSSLSSPLDGGPPASASADATDARCTMMHVTAWSADENVLERRLRKDSSSRITACSRRCTAADSIHDGEIIERGEGSLLVGRCGSQRTFNKLFHVCHAFLRLSVCVNTSPHAASLAAGRHRNTSLSFVRLRCAAWLSPSLITPTARPQRRPR
jgi:hypothetical protein